MKSPSLQNELLTKHPYNMVYLEHLWLSPNSLLEKMQKRCMAGTVSIDPDATWCNPMQQHSTIAQTLKASSPKHVYSIKNDTRPQPWNPFTALTSCQFASPTPSHSLPSLPCWGCERMQCPARACATKICWVSPSPTSFWQIPSASTRFSRSCLTKSRNCTYLQARQQNNMPKGHLYNMMFDCHVFTNFG